MQGAQKVYGVRPSSFLLAVRLSHECEAFIFSLVEPIGYHMKQLQWPIPFHSQHTHLKLTTSFM